MEMELRAVTPFSGHSQTPPGDGRRLWRPGL